MAVSDRLKLVSVVIFGNVCIAALIIPLGDLPSKWVVVFTLVACFPFLAARVGSLRNALMALLIFSLSVQMFFYPFYSDTQVGIQLSLPELVILATYIFWIFTLLHGTERVKFFPSVTVPLALLVLWSGASFFTAEKPSYVLNQFMIAIVGFLVYFYAANFLKSREDIYFIVKCVSIVLIFTALVAIGQYFKPELLNFKYMGWHEESLKLYYGTRTISRPSGFLGHANNLGSFLACWLPLLFAYIIGFDKQQSYQRLLLVASFALGFAALVLTFSRGSWLAFVFAIFLVLTVLSRRHIRRKIPKMGPRIFVLVIAGLIVVSLSFPNIRSRLSRDDYRAGESRITLAKSSLQLIKERPLMGYGIGYYSDFHPIPPHNMYLYTVVELGTIALVILVWISFVFLKQGVIAWQSSDTTILLFAIGLFAGLAGACLHGMVEPGTIGDSKFLWILFVGGLLVALGEFHKQHSASNLSEIN